MKRSPLRRKRRNRSKRAILAEKAWKVFSLFIRTRDNFICFTCDVKGDRNSTNAGHFKHGVLDFDEVNVNCQCIRCNKFLSGHLDVYAERLIDKYGIEKFNDLCHRATLALRGQRLTEKDYQDIIDKYGQHKQD